MSVDTERGTMSTMPEKDADTDALVARVRRPSGRVLAALLAVVALLVAGGVALDRGLMPWQDDAAGADGDRAAALTAARLAATTLTTLDAGAVDESTAAWAEVTTGDLQEAVASGESDFQALLANGGIDAESNIQDAAIATFDTEASVAEVLVAIDVVLTPKGGQPTTERLSLAVTVRDTGETAGGWKASGLTPVTRGTTVGADADELATDIAAAMVRLWSYDHRNLPGAESLAPITTADFLEEYAATYERIETLAPETKAVVTAEVTGIATIAVEGDRATLLVFLAQRARKGGEDPTDAQTRLRVAAEKVDGQWRVDGVTPI